MIIAWVGIYHGRGIMVEGTGRNDVGDGWIEGRKGVRKRGGEVVIGFRV